ncbi:MAG: aspartate 1-decarboxylase [Elusimicrobia bacterium]|nr:aspartate 1-decarboxylase [Elusimicrobiota bacterium]
MRRTMLKSKIHRVPVTQCDLNYNGSITIDRALCKKAGLLEFEKVDVYNCNTGARFSTYVLLGRKGQLCINGAAARLAHPGDRVIIASYADFDEAECAAHKPVVLTF